MPTADFSGNSKDPKEIPPIRGKLPEPEFTPARLTEAEKEYFRKKGLDPDKMDAVQVRAASEYLEKLKNEQFDVQKQFEKMGVSPDHRITAEDVLKDAVDFEDLPPEKQKELAEYVKQAADIEKRMQENAHLRNIASEADLKALASTPEKKLADMLEDKEEETEEPSEDKAEKSDNSSGEQSTADIFVQHGVCPKCGCNLNDPDPVELNDEDAYKFLIALLTPGQRFTKEFRLFGNHIRVQFRSISSTEEDIVRECVAQEIRAGKISDINEAASLSHQLRMVASLAFVAMEEIRVWNLPTIAEYAAKNNLDKPAALMKMNESVVEDVLSNASLKRVIGRTFIGFEKLCEALEAKGYEEDFFSKIQQPAT